MLRRRPRRAGWLATRPVGPSDWRRRRQLPAGCYFAPGHRLAPDPGRKGSGGRSAAARRWPCRGSSRPSRRRNRPTPGHSCWPGRWPCPTAGSRPAPPGRPGSSRPMWPPLPRPVGWGRRRPECGSERLRPCPPGRLPASQPGPRPAPDPTARRPPSRSDRPKRMRRGRCRPRRSRAPSRPGGSGRRWLLAGGWPSARPRPLLARPRPPAALQR